MFPASRSQQAVNTEYAFCNAAIGVRKKNGKKEERLDRLCKEYCCEIKQAGALCRH